MKIKIKFLVLLISVVFSAVTAFGSTVSFSLWAPLPGHLTPFEREWLTANFVDNGNNSVRLTLTGNTTMEIFIGKVYFNYASNITINSITPDANNTVIGGKIDLTPNGPEQFQADGVHGFDILYDYDTKNNPTSNRFDTDTLAYTITGTGITADSFKIATEEWYAAAHLQGINFSSYGYDSTWIGDSGEIGDPPPSAVPIPSTALLFGTGVIGILGARWKFGKRKNVS
jgi:hypothetical protein